MRRALMWLNVYDREAVRHKLKKSQKTQKLHFQPASRKFLAMRNITLFSVHMSIFITQTLIISIGQSPEKRPIIVQYHQRPVGPRGARPLRNLKPQNGEPAKSRPNPTIQIMLEYHRCHQIQVRPLKIFKNTVWTAESVKCKSQPRWLTPHWLTTMAKTELIYPKNVGA